MADSRPEPADPQPAAYFLLRRGEQAAAAVITLLALVALLAAWWLKGGSRGELLEIDRAEPRPIQFVVDVNAADWPELSLLPDVGETLAKRIVESREREGPFRDHEDIQRVRGIGPKTLEKLRPYLLPMPADEAIVEDSVDHARADAS
jgi:competence protein ComEA